MPKNISTWMVLIFAFLLGLTIRIFLSTLGHNYDVDSWKIVANLMVEGKSVYASTHRHNYGPTLFYVFQAIKNIETTFFFVYHPEAFHIVLACFLSIVDALIAGLLICHVNWVVAVLFLLNPVLILITGYHSQVDHIALLLALESWILIQSDRISLSKTMVSAALLGVSLMTKHDFIFFPIWLFFYKPLGSIWRRALYAFIAWGIFLSGFAFWWGDPAARAAIIKNVFQYQSFEGNSLLAKTLYFLFPPQTYWILEYLPISLPKLSFILAMCFAGYKVMKSAHSEAFYFYLTSLVVFTSAIADQYLAIPAIACAYFWRSKLIWIYVAVSTLLLLSSGNNVHILNTGFDFKDAQLWLTFFLFMALIRMTYAAYKPQSSLNISNS